MTRPIGKLTALRVQKIKEKGMYADGGGLYLRVTGTGGKFWVARFTQNGKAQEMGLGSLNAVTLAEARDKAREVRSLLSAGINPIKARDDAKAEALLAEANNRTFQQCAEAYIAAHKDAWRNLKHIQQWENTLKTYVYPVIGNLSAQAVDLNLVLKILEPIWKEKAETASRLRGRIEVVLDWATVRGYRKGENPARWRGHLETLLPAPQKVQRTEHHPALPYSDIRGFVSDLEKLDGIAPMALLFTILTAARTSETIGATWDEIDLENKLWIVPATRIKGGREHRVPLSDKAVAILAKLQEQYKAAGAQNDWVFQGARRGKPLSNMAMLTVLKRMGRKDITVHGFRSTFRDWAAEETSYPREVAESALAHVSGDKVELAYRRGDLFDKRRKMMEDWAQYCY